MKCTLPYLFELCPALAMGDSLRDVVSAANGSKSFAAYIEKTVTLPGTREVLVKYAQHLGINQVPNINRVDQTLEFRVGPKRGKLEVISAKEGRIRVNGQSVSLA